jgi:hypothetical protein
MQVTNPTGVLIPPRSFPRLLGVTASSVFLGGLPSGVFSAPLTASQPATLTALNVACEDLRSDTDAVYCGGGGASNIRIASSGTTSVLGPLADDGMQNNPYIVFDEVDAYWVDNVPAGTIVSAPKAGGGTVTVLARDTSPVAIAVDAHAVYWSDVAGFIKSVPLSR